MIQEGIRGGRAFHAAGLLRHARSCAMTPAMIPPDILAIGSVHWDHIGTSRCVMPVGADVPGRIVHQPGGVAFNIAAMLRRLGLRPALLSAIGRDEAGEALVRACLGLGLATDLIHRSDLATDRYLALEGPEGLVAAIADARSLEAAGTRILAPLADGRLGSAERPWVGPVALDGNLTADLLEGIALSPLFAAADLRIAPASPDKAPRLLPLLSHPGATLYANLAEASRLVGAPCSDAAAAVEALMGKGARRVLVTDGPRACAEGRVGHGVFTALPPTVRVTRVTGAGDTFMAAHVVADRAGLAPAEALARALAAAATHISGDRPS